MRTKTILVLLLILVLNSSSAGQTFFITHDPIEERQESSPGEERLARAFAIQFIKRLRVTDDFAPLVREFYIKNFISHMRKYLLDQNLDDLESLQWGIDPRILAHATQDDYRRAYLVSMNAWHQFHEFNDAVNGYVATTNSLEGGEIFDPRYQMLKVKAREDALTPAFFSNAKSNPLLSILVSNLIWETDESDESIYNARIRAATIRTVKELRVFMSALAQCVDLMRKAVRKLRSSQDALRVGRQVEFKNYEDSIRVYKYWTETLEKRTYGIRKGTKLIYARIYPYEIVMTRRMGKLKIITVYPDLDGD